jgi:GT2 family glycosyltransferase
MDKDTDDFTHNLAKASTNSRWVFAIIPVFNRLAFTLTCIQHLRSQTYRPLNIIVVDGGSTDGTVEILRGDHPDVTVLGGESELWWAGAMELGIRHVLSKSQNDADMVLMMNNDAVIPDDYVESLVKASQREKAAVGGVIVDSADPSLILDAGEMIDWENYTFPVKTEVSQSEPFFDGVDVLPGRGSLVPLYMIKKAGNIDAKGFPHYIADYEFFYRIRSHGFRIGVCNNVRILAHIKETGILPHSGKMTFREVFRDNFSRKSMRNVRDHWRFVSLCAPDKQRTRIKWRLAKVPPYDFLFRTKLGVIMCPIHAAIIGTIIFLRFLSQLTVDDICRVHGLPALIRWPAFFLLAPSPLTSDELRGNGLDADRLVHEGVLCSTRSKEWYVFFSLRWSSADRRALRRLFFRAWNPLFKISRSLRSRRDAGPPLSFEDSPEEETSVSCKSDAMKDPRDRK